MNLHSKIDAEFAPKMANSAVSKALENLGMEFAKQHPELDESKAIQKDKESSKSKDSNLSQDQKNKMKQIEVFSRRNNTTIKQ